MTKPIGREDLRAYAERSFFSLDEAELDTFEALVGDLLDGVARFEALPDPPRPVVAAERELGRPPRAGEDPLNAIVRWCSVRAEKVPREAPLAGLRVGLKDMFAIAGLPLGFGSTVLEGYVSDEDADVTARLLEAGAEIVAVTNMESFAFSAGGETTATGPVLNPFDLERTACGSSSGSAAALFYEGIDLTFGTDQGGSVRIPASWCGVLGLKPTHGLVPYTGTIPADWRFDHAGPMARDARTLARGLDAVAEERAFDPFTKTLYTDRRGAHLDAVEAAPDRLDGIRLGVLAEGFAAADEAAPAGTAETNRAVLEAVERLRLLGAEVVEVSVPAHRSATDIMFVALAESVTSAQRGASGGHAWWTRDLPHLKAGLG
ncbi:MAG TPA: amidase family protein, partial [Solirubrobacterales bacterium]